MKRKWIFAFFLLIGVIALVSVVSAAAVSGYTLDWWTVDGGGGTSSSSGGDYSISGSFGQPDAGTSSGGDYVLNGGFWAVPPSTYDDIWGARLIDDVPYLDESDTSGATQTPDDPDLTGCGLQAGLASVWYKYSPSSGREVTLDTLGSDYNTMIGVWSGSTGALTEVACNDDVLGLQQSLVTFTAVGGVDYYIGVSEYNGTLSPLNGVTGGNLNFHVESFADTYGNQWYWRYVEGFYKQGITTGCYAGPLRYCPDRAVTRAEMAVFILRSEHGGSYQPPAASGTFDDVPVLGKEWMEAWIEQFYSEGITTGCYADPLRYCPEREVTRAEMAVFILCAIHGGSYQPPAASHYFADVPVAGKEWMEAWMDEFYREGLTTGCLSDPLRYCPEQSVTRAEMATFIDRAYGFPPLP
jgi:hypothetical protein